jgi:hypothetical protein
LIAGTPAPCHLLILRRAFEVIQAIDHGEYFIPWVARAASGSIDFIINFFFFRTVYIVAGVSRIPPHLPPFEFYLRYLNIHILSLLSTWSACIVAVACIYGDLLVFW